MANIVDKRFTPKQGDIANRQKFIRRYKEKIKRAIRENIGEQSIKDFKFKGQKVKIKTIGDMDLPEPELSSEKGIHEGIAVGNKEYQKGDKVQKPYTGQGSGSQGSDQGGGEDSFEFELTEREFQDLFFDGLELPDMVKKNFIGDVYEYQRLGYSTSGGPSSLNVVQTMKRAIGRFLSLMDDKKDDEEITLDDEKVPFIIEDVDLRYNYRDKVDLPSSRSVMFCLMDVSGSMDEIKKDIAKRIFILLNMFLKRNYTTVDVVFVRHAEWAEECDEDTFFYDRSHGGTIISKGLEKIDEIIKERYNPEQWNIYIAQATDGDNFDYDNFAMVEVLKTSLLPVTQYYTFIEISDTRRDGMRSDVFRWMERLSTIFTNLKAVGISDYRQILDVFRGLFSQEKK